MIILFAGVLHLLASCSTVYLRIDSGNILGGKKVILIRFQFLCLFLRAEEGRGLPCYFAFVVETWGDFSVEKKASRIQGL